MGSGYLVFWLQIILLLLALGATETWIQIPVLPFADCATLNKSLHLSEPVSLSSEWGQ